MDRYSITTSEMFANIGLNINAANMLIIEIEGQHATIKEQLESVIKILNNENLISSFLETISFLSISLYIDENTLYIDFCSFL